MNPALTELCESMQVDIKELRRKIQLGLCGHDIRHFTDEELSVLLVCVEVAGEF